MAEWNTERLGAKATKSHPTCQLPLGVFYNHTLTTTGPGQQNGKQSNKNLDMSVHRPLLPEVRSQTQKDHT